MSKRLFSSVAVLLAALVVLAGCGAAEDDSADPTPTRVSVEGAPTLADMAAPPQPEGEEAAASPGASPVAPPGASPGASPDVAQEPAGEEEAAAPAGEPIELTAVDIAWEYNGERSSPGQGITINVTPGQTIVITNQGVTPHDFASEDLGLAIDLLAAGETAEVTIPEDAAPGEYSFLCTVAGHAAAGMVGTLVIG